MSREEMYLLRLSVESELRGYERKLEKVEDQRHTLQQKITLFKHALKVAKEEEQKLAKKKK
jgi:hypothetical protein